jgi:ADP-ribosylglycohydrolase
MAGWNSTFNLLLTEFVQSAEEGRDSAQLELLRSRLDTIEKNDLAALETLYKQIINLPISESYQFVEPSDLKSIQESRPYNQPSFNLKLNDDQLFDKMYGAWLGRCVGCALGKPVEGFMGSHNGLASWQRQKQYLTAISPDEWPIKDYFPQHSPDEDETGKIWCYPSTREEIAYMETDDDIRYTVLGQIVLQKYGRDFTTWDVAKTWVEYLPYQSVCTAETQAYRNFVEIYDFQDGATEPRKFDWSSISLPLNPYREWIGAQIRVDSYGYGAAGNPVLAAEWAWRDARLSHVKNGIYGAMFCAAMIAASFATDNLEEIVEAGLSQIPTTSRLYRELRDVIDLCALRGNNFWNFEDVIEGIYERLGHYNAVHTNNNAAICAAAVLLSGGDFEKGITFAVMAGLDTDCNGATVGSILGAITGAKNAPTHWTGRLNDTLNSAVIGYHPISIKECALRSTEIALKLRV